uniref:Leydig cell tumor 10 kDa protein homolog n=1 Tax=Amphimedon queenslandica TaxID=400682 RepID=A0A1X7UHB4_AMPQE
MAQGGLKKKSGKFVPPSSKSKGNKSSSSSASGSKKPQKTRKGPHYIAPKKARLVAAEKVKSNLRKAIGRKIEEELVTQASSEGENLRVLNTSLKKKGKNS